MSDSQRIIQELLHQHTPVVFKAGGSSMNPTIRDGEAVRIRPLQSRSLQSSIVILYKIHARIALHRLVFNDKRTTRHFVVGDAATEGGDWISTADILGVAEWVQRGDKIHRLDTRSSRIRGGIRYRLRPLRRVVAAIYRHL